MKNRSYFLPFVLAVLFFVNLGLGQDLLDILEKETPDMPMFTQATFKANRVVLGQSVETRKRGTMEFVFGTRYWNIPNNDASQSFGADRFSAHFGLQYAFTDRFTFGAGVTTYDGIFNGFAKYRLVRQREDTNVPLGITLLGGASYFSRDFARYRLPDNSSERLSYVGQLIIARKFNRNLSLQISPTYIRTGSNQPIADAQNLFLLGFAGRYKLGNHVSIASEYGYLFNRDEGSEGYNLFSLGVNWEIADLILQFSMSNSKSFDDISNYTFNPNNFHFRPGGLHIGVNATYVLHLSKQKSKNVKEDNQK